VRPSDRRSGALAACRDPWGFSLDAAVEGKPPTRAGSRLRQPLNHVGHASIGALSVDVGDVTRYVKLGFAIGQCAQRLLGSTWPVFPARPLLTTANDAPMSNGASTPTSPAELLTLRSPWSFNPTSSLPQTSSHLYQCATKVLSEAHYRKERWNLAAIRSEKG